MVLYYEQTDPITGTIICKNNEDGSISFIPIDESNSDYQRYLAWLNGEAKGDLIS